MEGRSSLLDEDKALFCVLGYYGDKLVPLRLINRGFSDRLAQYREFKAAKPVSDGALELYMAARALILNPRVTKKVSLLITTLL